MANEVRLIDANALKSKMRNTSRYFYIKYDIDEAPTVDAVEVVRCKDCRFILDRVDGTHGCYRHFMDDCNPDDFCSYGERKDNERKAD